MEEHHFIDSVFGCKQTVSAGTFAVLTDAVLFLEIKRFYILNKRVNIILYVCCCCWIFFIRLTQSNPWRCAGGCTHTQLLQRARSRSTGAQAASSCSSARGCKEPITAAAAPGEHQRSSRCSEGAHEIISAAGLRPVKVPGNICMSYCCGRKTHMKLRSERSWLKGNVYSSKLSQDR